MLVPQILRIQLTLNRQCGQERPICVQCTKSNRECSGYREHPVFVTYQTPAAKSLSNQVSKSDLLQDSQPRHVSRQQQVALSKRKSNSTSLHPCKVLTSEVATRPLCQQISYKPAHRQQILGIYMDQIVPKVDLGLLKERMWIESIPCLPHLTVALESAVMAMCFAKIGDFNGDERFKLEGLQLYHRALRELRVALLDPQLLYDDQTLGACVALTHYEMTECPSDSMQPYMSHIAGCEKLIHLRGPDRHRDGIAHKIFAHFRVQAVSISWIGAESVADCARYCTILVFTSQHFWRNQTGNISPGKMLRNRHMIQYGIY